MFELFKRYFYILFFLFLSLPLLATTNDGSRYAQNSVLSGGSWYKIKIPETGVYKLTYDDLKNKIGLTNPADVKIYGYGGWILDEDFSKPYVDDLPQVSIWMSNTPENFSKNDYILFYAKGNVKWEYNSDKKEFEHTLNPYSDNNYYFVTESEDAPLLMETQEFLSGSSGKVVSTFQDYALHKEESKNIGESGRDFYGDYKKPFTLETEGVTSDPAILRYNFISNVTFPGGQNVTPKINGVEKRSKSVPVLSTSDYYTFGTSTTDTIILNNLETKNSIELSFKSAYKTDKNLYLDYTRINYNRQLKPYGAVTLFRVVEPFDNLTYQIANASSSLVVLDVTNNTQVRKVDTKLEGSTMSFTAPNTSIREYALVDLSNKNIPTPTLSDKNDSQLGTVLTQNLHSLSGYDMVIIVQPFLQSYANTLAELHEEDSGLKSLVVNPQQIYNEFSSGKPDVTAYRRFMKMFYDRAQGGDDRPKYLLLFGGGTYDNKLLESAWSDSEKKSMLLTYQSENSLSELTSYVTDDYLGFLDDSSGKNLGQDVLNISVGRLPIRNEQEAKDIVAKIDTYIKNKNKGVWLNDILYVADDLIGSKDNSDERAFINDAETFANYTNSNYSNFITNKVYEDAYERVVGANGGRYPDATKALLDKINRGVLVLNFIGHGATTYWTHENLLNSTDIEALNNDKQGLWITATCDFSRYDANKQSGGELALLKKTGGAIGLFSTVRTVYIDQNTTMNTKITKYLLERDEHGKPLRIGDIMRKAKSEMQGDENKLRFALLGDPALRLAFPDDTYTVQVTEMNGKNASTDDINIQALSNTVIVGNIVDKNGEVITDFNGTLESVVFDAEQELRTRGNNRNGESEKSRGTDYKAYTNILFTGKVKVVNGTFRIEFIAPKDILYTNTNGKMSFYAYESNSTREAQGSFFNYTIGGTNSDVEDEFDGPVIEKMYLDKENFKSGDFVNPTPQFYAEVSDETGINLSSGIGHNIVLTIDGNTPYDLTPYFKNEDDSSKKGSVSFQIPELSLGNHYFEFKVWDVLNNSTTSGPIDFVVTDNTNSSTYTFDIWGNPARDLAKFVFETESPKEDVNIKISVYTLSGRMVWTKEIKGEADGQTQYIQDWNLTGDAGGQVLPGVYICNAHITIKGKTNSVKSQKLIISSN